MFENPRRACRQARNLTTNVSKILDLKSSFEEIYIFRKLTLGAPDLLSPTMYIIIVYRVNLNKLSRNF